MLGIQVLWNPAKTSGIFNYLLKFTTDGPTGFHDSSSMTHDARSEGETPTSYLSQQTTPDSPVSCLKGVPVRVDCCDPSISHIS